MSSSRPGQQLQQYVAQSLFKFGWVVLESRLVKGGSQTPRRIKHDNLRKWCELEVEETFAYTGKLQQWLREPTKPMVIEVFLIPSSQSNRFDSTGPTSVPGLTFLERWTISFSPVSTSQRQNSSQRQISARTDPSQVYQQMVLRARILACVLRHLPAREAKRCAQRSSGALEVKCTVDYQRNQGSDMYSSGQLGNYRFKPLEVGNGSISIHVEYAKDVNYQDIEKLIAQEGYGQGVPPSPQKSGSISGQPNLQRVSAKVEGSGSTTQFETWLDIPMDDEECARIDDQKVRTTESDSKERESIDIVKEEVGEEVLEIGDLRRCSLPMRIPQQQAIKNLRVQSQGMSQFQTGDAKSQLSQSVPVVPTTASNPDSSLPIPTPTSPPNIFPFDSNTPSPMRPTNPQCSPPFAHPPPSQPPLNPPSRTSSSSFKDAPMTPQRLDSWTSSRSSSFGANIPNLSLSSYSPRMSLSKFMPSTPYKTAIYMEQIQQQLQQQQLQQQQLIQQNKGGQQFKSGVQGQREQQSQDKVGELKSEGSGKVKEKEPGIEQGQGQGQANQNREGDELLETSSRRISTDSDVFFPFAFEQEAKKEGSMVERMKRMQPHTRDDELNDFVYMMKDVPEIKVNENEHFPKYSVNYCEERIKHMKTKWHFK